jgi:APA family basic amino acid/polyamine antiporter
MIMMNVFRKESIKSYLGKDSHLAKTMSAKDLMALGIGAVIGTGIFILPGTVAAKTAGPGVTLSFILAALVCMLSAMCYAEFASDFPVAGSAYSYGNLVYGELIGWVLGWSLVLEYMLAVSAVSSGWSAYFQSFLQAFKVKIPAAIAGPMNLKNGVYFDLISILIVILIAILLQHGMKTSTKVNNWAVVLKIAIILAFIVIGSFFIKPANYHPFMPYHFSGVIKGAATVFFAFLGFDAVSSSAAEVKKPQRNMPIGIIGTLLVAAVLYFAVSLVLTGMVNYKHLDVANPVAYALNVVHQGWAAELLSLGALIGMATMMLTMIYSSSRLIYAMARDGLLPQGLAKLSKHQTPNRALWAVTIIIAIGGGIASVDQLTSLVNFGTLLAFTLVSFGIIPLRRRQDLPHTGFQVPGYPVVPILSGLICIGMMLQLSSLMWIIAGIWFGIGLIIYFAYGYWHSRLNK